MLCLEKDTIWHYYEMSEDAYFGAGGASGAATDRGRCAGPYRLAEIEAKARSAGARRLIGPIAGDTWHSYRAVTGSSGEPFFALEPNFCDPGFGACGYAQIASYSSALVDLSAMDPAESRRKINLANFKFDNLDIGRFDSELEALWQLSLTAFRNNFLYQPITYLQFRDLYLPLRNSIDGRYVLMVRDKGELVGCLFCFIDFLSPVKKRLVVKTIARSPQRRYAGLGEAMLSLMLARAKADGFEEAVLALFKDDNVSSKLSERFKGRKFRSYGLFAREFSDEY